MKITYRREMKHNYLILDPEDLEWDGYECRMLAANSIEGVLRFQIRQMDENIYFYYEITSKQPLTRMLDGRFIRAEELRCLILGIARVVDRMEQYLLKESSVMLSPEYLYVEPENFRVWLCLVPGVKRSFPEDYASLLEYLLGKVDHQDKDSVVLAYALYQETRKTDYGMDDILRILQNAGRRRAAESGQENHLDLWKDGSEEREDIGSRYEENSGWEEENSTRVKKNAQAGEMSGGRPVSGEWQENKNWADQNQIEEDGQETGSNKRREKKKEKNKKKNKNNSESDDKNRQKQSIWSRFRNWWRRLWKREKSCDASYESERRLTANDPAVDTDQAGMQAENSWEMMFGSEEYEQEGAQQISKEFLESQQEEIDWSKCSFSNVEQDTIELGNLEIGEVEKNHRLIALDPGLRDIELLYYPFIIGKQENLVDFVLDRGVVSRLHLRIDCIDSEYTVEDLNSTNGTMVAGKLLEANETVTIKDGDEIRIADCRYRFVMG